MGVTEATVRRLALSLPATAEAPHYDMTAFRAHLGQRRGSGRLLRELLVEARRRRAPKKMLAAFEG